MLGSFVLAVVAAAALALGADDASLLRLGIVAALWAALLGTFAAVRMRREVSSGADHAEELRTIYRLELDREIAARREHELTVERELREQVERRERDEITALRGELQSLRDTLRNLLGGDVLVERVALRAESTRLLPLPDHSRTVADGPGRAPSAGTTAGVPRSLTAAESPARRAGRDPRDVGQRPDPPQRRQEPVDAPTRPAAQPTPRRDADPRPAPGGGGRSEPDIFTRTAAELAGNAGSADRSWSPAVAAPPTWQPAVPPAGEVSGRSRTSSRHAEPGRPAPAPSPAPAPVQPVPAAPRGAGQVNAFPDQEPQGSFSGQASGSGRHSRPSAPRYGGTTQAAPGSNGNGSHTYGAHGNGAHGNGLNGSGSQPNRHSGGRRQSAEEIPAGAHGGGRPVDDLLAAYGESAAPRRRRRRADD